MTADGTAGLVALGRGVVVFANVEVAAVDETANDIGHVLAEAVGVAQDS